jgi:4-amino-4-deoxy-L-arabinose transferase-like glycosyltransferase
MNPVLRVWPIRLVLLAVLGVALLLRTWGSDYGLPAYTRYHPDEHALVERAAAVLWTGDWNLGRFNYPPLYAYMQAGAYSLYFLYGVTQELWRYVPSFAVPNYYLVGRLLTAVFGTLTVLVVFLTGRQVSGRRTGVLAAALLAVNYLHVVNSHYATFDIMVAFWVSLTVLFSLLIHERRQTKWYVLAGLMAGLAASTKYNGAVVILVPLLGHILSTRWGEWGWLDRRLLYLLAAFALGFFGGNPFALGNLPDFLNDLATVLHHYGTRHPGFEGRGNWRWYVTVFMRSADAPWIVTGVLGLLILLVREWRKGLLVAAFPVLYFLMVSGFIVRFERNMVPLLPVMALGGAWLLNGAADWVATQFGRDGGLSDALAASLTLALVALPVTAAILFDIELSRVDHREAAGQWVERNIKPGSKIAIEHYSIPFDYNQYHVEDMIRITERDLSWYLREGYEVVIISDGVWEVLRQQSRYYAEELLIYDELVARSELLAEFVRTPPGLVVAGYPTVGVFHFAPVRILRLAP